MNGLSWERPYERDRFEADAALGKITVCFDVELVAATGPVRALPAAACFRATESAEDTPSGMASVVGVVDTTTAGNGELNCASAP